MNLRRNLKISKILQAWRSKITVLREEISQIWKKSKQDLIFTQATALAYTTLVSLLPILAIAFFLFHAFGGFEILLEKMEPFIEDNLAPSFSNQISSYLEGFINSVHAGTVGIVGLFAFIFTSISTLATIEKTFNLIWGSHKQRSLTRRMTTYWSLLTLAPLLMALSILMSSKVLSSLQYDKNFFSQTAVLLLHVIPYLSMSALFSSLYMFLPSVTVDRRDAIKAGVFTGIIFELAKVVYAIYATHAIKNNAVYGSLIIIPVFLVWLYVVWVIILFGAELCCFLQFKRLGIGYQFGVEDRLNPFIAVDIIEALGAHQQEPSGGLNLAGLIVQLKLPMRDIIRHVDFLEEEGIVVRSEGTFMTGGRFYLTLPKDQIQISEIFEHIESVRYTPQSERAIEAHSLFKDVWKNFSTSKSKKNW
jgi:membrane protein